jgi:hypothetical protein
LTESLHTDSGLVVDALGSIAEILGGDTLIPFSGIRGRLTLIEETLATGNLALGAITAAIAEMDVTFDALILPAVAAIGAAVAAAGTAETAALGVIASRLNPLVVKDPPTPAHIVIDSGTVNAHVDGSLTPPTSTQHVVVDSGTLTAVETLPKVNVGTVDATVKTEVTKWSATEVPEVLVGNSVANPVNSLIINPISNPARVFATNTTANPVPTAVTSTVETAVYTDVARACAVVNLPTQPFKVKASNDDGTVLAVNGDVGVVGITLSAIDSDGHPVTAQPLALHQTLTDSPRVMYTIPTILPEASAFIRDSTGKCGYGIRDISIDVDRHDQPGLGPRGGELAGTHTSLEEVHRH